MLEGLSLRPPRLGILLQGSLRQRYCLQNPILDILPMLSVLLLLEDREKFFLLVNYLYLVGY